MPDLKKRPADISLFGEVNEKSATEILESLRGLEGGDGEVIFEATTPGGDAEFARRLVLEIDCVRERTGRRMIFVGKTQVYSAGVTIMSAFPKADRYLTRDCMLLIHVRQLEKSVEISGPMRASLPEIDALKGQIEVGMKAEDENFRRLVRGSDIELQDLLDKALHNWYLTAEDALGHGLVAEIV
ncbi:MAG: ATP-dependent Clp protease proteolytic subunit [Parasphingopyxis sp.]|nr:ATP-dependent Clp protease proteolytic subunit [Sphingomonadales bacterium]